jgi:hypothetical protein
MSKLISQATVLEQLARAAIDDIVEDAIESIYKIESERIRAVIRERVEDVARGLAKSVSCHNDIAMMRDTLSIELKFDGEKKDIEL